MLEGLITLPTQPTERSPYLDIISPPARRRYAYRNGKMVEITHERQSQARYPLIKISEKDWNEPQPV